MMKSENHMSRDVVKRRLNSLFGDYSEFIKPSQQREVRGDSTTNVKTAAENSRNIDATHRNEDQQELLMNGTGGGKHEGQQRNGASVDNMIEIMNIPRPISPVQSSNTSTPKCIVKSLLPADLDAIINQISSVSPLLSPIRLDIFNNNDAAVASGSAETTTNRKRPNSGEEVIKAKKKKIKKTEGEQPVKKIEEQPLSKIGEKPHPSSKTEEKPLSSLLYLIKLKPPTFKKLLQRLDDQQKTKKNDAAKLDEPKTSATVVAGVVPTSTTKNSNKQSKSTTTSAAQNNLIPVEAKITFNVPANTKKSSFDYFTGRSRELRKKAAENEKDKTQQILLSFESIAYYIMASSTLSLDKMHQSIVDNTNRINSTWSTFKRQKMPDSLNALRTRLKYLQMMISACLAYQLYSIRSNQAFSAYSLLAQYEKENPVAQRRPTSRATTNGGATSGNGTNGADSAGNISTNGANTSTTTTNSSPAASTPGSLNSQATVIVPVEIYNALTAQNKTLHHLMWSFKLWNDAKDDQPADCKKFMDHLAQLYGGELKQNSELVDVAEYLLTAVYLLRQECIQGGEGGVEAATTITENCNKNG